MGDDEEDGVHASGEEGDREGFFFYDFSHLDKEGHDDAEDDQGEGDQWDTSSGIPSKDGPRQRERSHEDDRRGPPAGPQGHRRPGRATHIDIQRPLVVPRFASKLFQGAAEHLAKNGKLIKASGEVNYEGALIEYRRMLAAMDRAVAGELGTD